MGAIMFFLKVCGKVVAFRDEEFYNLARYAMIYPGKVYKNNSTSYTIYNVLSGQSTEVRKIGVKDFRTSFYPCRDSASLFTVCEMIVKRGV